MVASIIRKILLFLLVIGCGFVIYKGYSEYKLVKQSNIDVLEVVPENPTVVFEFDKMEVLSNKLRSNSVLWNNLKAENGFKSINQVLNVADTLSRKNELVKRMLNKQTVVAGYLNANYSLDLILLSHGTKNEFNELVELLSKEGVNTDKVIIGSAEGVSINSNGNLIFHKEIIAFSNSKSLLEKALNTNGNTELKSKMSIGGSGLDVDVNAYVNYQKLAKSAVQKIIPVSENSSELGNLVKSLNFDFFFSSNAIVGRGFSSIKDSISFVKSLSSQPTIQLELLNKIPSSTIGFSVISLGNKEAFFQERFNQYPQLLEEIENYDTKYETDLVYHLTSWVKDEAMVVKTNFQGLSRKDNNFLVFNTESEQSAKELLEDLSYNINTVEVGNSDTLTLNRLILPVNLGYFYGPMFSRMETPYFWVDEGFVVFGKTKEALNKYVLNTKAKSLVENENFITIFKQELSDSCLMLNYIKPNKIEGIKNILSKEGDAFLEQNKAVLKHSDFLAWQVTPHTKDKVFNTLVYHQIGTSTKNKEDVSAILWDKNLNGLKRKPQVVYNHRSKSKNVLLFDVNNQLRLFSASGEELWKTKIGENIVGEIHQIDLLNNKKKQFAFTTKSKLYIVDILGRNVKGFPVQLSSESTLGLSPVDYDKNGKYRFLIASGSKVLNYNKEGKKVEGWIEEIGDTILIEVPKHYVIDNKDYLFTYSYSGRTFLLNRKGEERFESKGVISNPNEYVFVEPSSTIETTKIIYNDTAGNVVMTYLGGTTQNLDLTPKVGANSLKMIDVNQSKTKDFVFKTATKLNVFTRSLIKINSISTGVDYQSFDYCNDHDEAVFAIEKDNIVQLYNLQGKRVGEPLYEGSKFYTISDINGDGMLNLILHQKETRKLIVYNLLP